MRPTVWRHPVRIQFPKLACLPLLHSEVWPPLSLSVFVSLSHTHTHFLSLTHTHTHTHTEGATHIYLLLLLSNAFNSFKKMKHKYLNKPQIYFITRLSIWNLICSLITCNTLYWWTVLSIAFMSLTLQKVPLKSTWTRTRFTFYFYDCLAHKIFWAGDRIQINSLVIDFNGTSTYFGLF